MLWIIPVSGYITRPQDLVRAVAPQVKTVQHPVQLLGGQLDGIIADIWRCFETLGLQALEPEAEAVAFPVEDLYPVAGPIQKHKPYGVEHGSLDVQLDRGSQAVNGLSEVHRLGVQVDFFHFGARTHHVENLQRVYGRSAGRGQDFTCRWGLWSAYRVIAHCGGGHTPARCSALSGNHVFR